MSSFDNHSAMQLDDCVAVGWGGLSAKDKEEQLKQLVVDVFNRLDLTVNHTVKFKAKEHEVQEPMSLDDLKGTSQDKYKISHFHNQIVDAIIALKKTIGDNTTNWDNAMELVQKRHAAEVSGLKATHAAEVSGLKEEHERQKLAFSDFMSHAWWRVYDLQVKHGETHEFANPPFVVPHKPPDGRFNPCQQNPFII